MRQWWEVEGLTAGRIVQNLGKMGYTVTRNAVIGKVHRLKLVAPEWKAEKLRNHQSGLRAIRHRKTAKNVVRQIIIRGKKWNPIKHKEAVVSSSDVAPDGSKRVLLKDSKPGQCKYIVGYLNGRCEDAVFCGEKTSVIVREGRKIATPWCPHHAAICITEPKPRHPFSYRGEKTGPRTRT
jgi:hypothetical protein